MALLGLLGTGHCLGMCGPLVLALPFSSRGFWVHLIYHLGRVTTYVVVGTAMAGLGEGLRYVASTSGEDPLGTVARLQVILSLIATLLLLAFGLARLGVIPEPSLLALASPGRVPGFEKLRQGTADRGGLGSVFGLGLLLGLLPCGLSYAAFSRALAAPDPATGALMVAVFGLGTTPGLLILGTGGAAFARKHRRLADILAGVLLVGMAVTLGADAVGALVG
jgi:hypothetical protein